MNKIIVHLCFVISFLVQSTYCIASTISKNDIQPLINDIEAEAGDLVGGAMAIVVNDQVVYKKTFGQKELGGSSVDEDTLFGIASVSKALTATALAALADKGIVSFDDQILIHGAKLPLKKILSHTSGFKIRGDSDIEKGVSRQSLLASLKNENGKDLRSGNGYFYSNLVYSFSQDYAQSKGYDMSKLLDVLHTGSSVLPVTSDNRTSPYSPNREQLRFPSNYQKIVPASAGVFSSLNGMVEFLHIILGKRPNIVSQKMLTQIFTPVAEANDVFNWKILPFKDQDVTSAYCLGWRKLTLKSTDESTLIFHSGRINGATAFVGILPDSQVGIVLMTNETSRFPLSNGLKLWKEIVQKQK